MSVKIFVGDARAVLRNLPENSIHCCITSPPYFGLRNYNIDGQIGSEETPAGFVKVLVDVFSEVHRVLRPDGTLWLNLGDSYAKGRTGRYDSGNGERHDKRGRGRFGGADMGTKIRFPPPGFKDKDLLMIPARVAIALQEFGWYLRSEIIWNRLNVMPESVFDRPTNAHEKIFLLSKSKHYFYDQDAVREPALTIIDNELGRNLRNVWSIMNNVVSSNGHFATFPTKLIMPCIQAGTSAGGACRECGTPLAHQYSHEIEQTQLNDFMVLPTKELKMTWHHQCKHTGLIKPCTVLDPFFGTGTTAAAAMEYGQDAVGIEMNPDYAQVAADRLMALGCSVEIH